MTSDALPQAMRLLCPDNLHPIPIAEAFDGLLWTVDLAYRRPGMDVDTTAIHQDLHVARYHAYANLKRELSKR